MRHPANIVRTLRALLGGSDRFSAEPFVRLNDGHNLAHQCVRYFYLASALFMWLAIPRLHQTVINDPPLELAWPLLWAEGFPMLMVVDVLSVSCATFAALAFWKPANPIWRCSFALTLLLSAAVPVSFGSVNHSYHEWIWLAFVFVFLPNTGAADANRAAKLSYCLTFAAAQGLVLMFYSMAGLWKASAGVISLIKGEAGNFSPNSLAWTVADRMAQTNTEPLLGPFIVDNAMVAWPLFLGLMYAQIVSLAIAFRPTLHCAWGWILIAFHTGTFLLMEIAFPTHIAILMLLLIASPFQRQDWLQWSSLRHLPIVGRILERIVEPLSRQRGNGVVTKKGATDALPNI